jgi:osmotically-inducible protein OsmY
MPTTIKGLGAFAAGAAVGAAAEYMMDPADGKRRRHTARDQAMAKLRRGSREAERKAHYAAGKAQGVAAEATPPGRDASELNDQSLEAKVESELFRPQGAPKSSVDINVQDHVVFLRGEVESREALEDLISRAKEIDGVAQVENRLSVK